jgi:simple sugar transport system substrate-binding protein
LETTKEKIVKGSLKVYTGAIEDNTGKTRIPAGKAYAVTAPELTQIDWLAEGISGKTS